VTSIIKSDIVRIMAFPPGVSPAVEVCDQAATRETENE